ncbi:MAG: hypothetical protein ACI8RZ_001868 [Myxococcota bacterium]|jgi:hypothetical protein
MSASRCRALLPLALAGCAQIAPAEYDYGTDLETLEYNLYSLSAGVYPSTDVLDDPNNPFHRGVGIETKWEIQSADLPIAGYYAWATWLTGQPNGEAQFYTAVNLHAIHDRGLADPDDLYYVRLIALDAYQTVLDMFPDAVTYDATGTIAYELAPQAYAGIEALGGVVAGDWTLITNDDGSTVLIPGG